MKKLICSVIATTSLLLATTTSAATEANGGYKSSFTPGTSLSFSATALWPTHVFILNMTNMDMRAVVHPYVNQAALAGGTAIITNEKVIPMPVVVYDKYNGVVYNGPSLCNRAIMTISQVPGAYRINVNREYCTN
jgi:hypothetical protein